MQNERQIISEIEGLRDLLSLVETYENISATTMRRIRTSVLHNRDFHLGLNDLYQQVKNAYQAEMKRRMRRKEKFFEIKKNGKTALVFFSANEGLYGDIIEKTFSAFLSQIKKQTADYVVVGKIGKTFLENFMPQAEFAYFDFPDNKMDMNRLKEIANHLVPYEKVYVFHGMFKSFFTQEATTSSIAGEIKPPATPQEEEKKYIFEPSLENIAAFFESEIFASMLEQALQESRLAKVASRLTLMDRSTVKIGEKLKNTLFISQQMKHRALNKKQLNALAGIALWANNKSAE